MKIGVRSGAVAALALAVATAGCSAGAGSPSTLPGLGGMDAFPGLATHGAEATTLYVGDATPKGYLFSIPIKTSSQNVVPKTQIHGTLTKLVTNYFLAVDAPGREWTATCPSISKKTGAAVLAFAAGTSGNKAPTLEITGAATTLSGCLTGVAIDAHGDVYVADENSNAIDVFAPGKTGNVAPIRRITGAKTLLRAPAGLALDNKGSLYVANSCVGEYCNGSVTAYKATATGNVAPLRNIVGNKTGIGLPQGLALDPAGNLYVANNNANSVTVYAHAATATGNVAPLRTYIGNTSSKIAAPSGIAVDGAGNLYVGNIDTFYVTNWAVLEFAATKATGKIGGKPLRTWVMDVAGSDMPSGIAVK